ncbi:hypothetical protein ACH4U3_19155 [Streptomyces griseoruber]|uniref:hypothetical protein n=1 Tax=Streptomyces griseoruber TaxID=1943 RepID=UPI0037AD38B9
MEPADLDDPAFSAFSHVVEHWRYGNDPGVGPLAPGRHSRREESPRLGIWT